MIRTEARRRAVRFLLATAAGAAGVAGHAGVAVAAPSPEPTGTVLQAGSADAISGSYIVVLKQGSDAAARVTSASHALAERYGGTVRNNYLATVRGFAIDMSAAEAQRLAADPSVDYVEQDRVVSLAGTQTDATWGLDRVDQKNLPLSTTYTSVSAAAVTAYVLDTGIRTTHAEFGGRAANGWDFIDGDAVANDCNGHGTHVAGTLGGTTYGVAKDVKIVGVRVLDCQGSGSYSAIISAIDWVTAHAVKPAVANMSLGGPADKGLDDAVKRSVAAGVTYALAAGNSNTPACNQSPARADTAITVGATDADDARATFSNYGSCVDLFAPGVRITSASYSSDTGTAIMNGTSMASPHVAGAAALVLGRFPAYTPAQVRTALVTNGTTGSVTAAGPGSPNVLLHTGWITAAGPPAPVPAPVPTPAKTVTPTPVKTVTPVPAKTVTPACGPFVTGTKVPIPDLRTVTSRRTVTGCPGSAPTTGTVTVDIKHTFRGSLQIALLAPNGRVYNLKTVDKADGADNVKATWTFNGSASPRNGTWTLRITDAAKKDVGQLNSWTLKL